MDAASMALRDRIKTLYAERSAMETEMAEIAQRLSGPGMPGLRGSLVDAEGFPMPGVDLYAVGETFFLLFFLHLLRRTPNSTFSRHHTRPSLIPPPSEVNQPSHANLPPPSGVDFPENT